MPVCIYIYIYVCVCVYIYISARIELRCMHTSANMFCHVKSVAPQILIPLSHSIAGTHNIRGMIPLIPYVSPMVFHLFL